MRTQIRKKAQNLGKIGNGKPVRVVVERNENGTPTGLETVDKTELFKGEENSLVMFQTYTHDFQCSFDLKKYPFDTQTCSIEMAMGPLDEASVRLFPDKMHMNQSLNMAIFQIKNWTLHEETYDNGRTTLKMTMILKRKITSELMTTYFPTLLLTATTFATTFFNPGAFHLDTRPANTSHHVFGLSTSSTMEMGLTI